MILRWLLSFATSGTATIHHPGTLLKMKQDCSATHLPGFLGKIIATKKTGTVKSRLLVNKFFQ